MQIAMFYVFIEAVGLSVLSPTNQDQLSHPSNKIELSTYRDQFEYKRAT